MGSRQADVRKHVRRLRERGYTVTLGRKHYRVLDGDTFVTHVCATPSDIRWKDNSVRDIAKYERQRDSS
jgi:hypothetical protein